jgi:drug/metabolite transporter (DMT)-like permease
LLRRKWPSFRMLTGACLVMVGVAILARVSWGNLRLGRGEWETIVASVFFTGQILWVERPQFAANDTNHFSAIMFAVMALVCLPVVILTTRESADCIKAFRPPATWLFVGLLVIFCTMGGYMLMNRWQRHVPVAQAGLIYGLEPVFTSLFALFLPAWFSAVSGIAYPNEVITWQMLAGGGLIIAANVLVQIPGKKETSMSHPGPDGVPAVDNQPGSPH